MSQLTTKARNNLPASSFALPAERKYPIRHADGSPDPIHDRNALARAAGAANAGKISRSTEAKIDAAAHRALGKKK